MGLMSALSGNAGPVEPHSIPNRSVTHFAIETAGNFDTDAALKIWISGNPLPITREFNKEVDVCEVQAVLGHDVLR